MKATVDAAELAGMLGGLKLGDARIKLKKGQKKEDAASVVICAQNNRLRVQLETWDTILTGYNSAGKCWDTDCARYWITAEINAKVVEEGAYKLSLAVAKKIAKFCTSGNVELNAAGIRMEISQGKRKSAVAVESAEMVRFPEIGPGVIVPRDSLRGVIGSHAAPDDTLNCLHQWAAVEQRTTGTTVSWTDGAQMFWQTLEPDLPGDRILVPLFAIECLEAFKSAEDAVECLEAFKSAEDAVECTPTGIQCGSCCVTYLEQAPSYPHTLDVVQQAERVSGYTEVKTTCEEVRAMLKQLSSCMDDEVVLSATNDQLRMLAYDDKGGKCADFDRCPRAETWVDAAVDRPFGAVGLNAARLKRAIGRYSGALTLRVLDADSPIFMDIESSGIRTVLMPLRPSFDKTTID
jgi:hypothetical protein